jgi:ribonuclease HII
MSGMAIKYIVGIDEAGRGPLAGPVTVGAVLAKVSSLGWLVTEFFPHGIKDSKKLTPLGREEIFRRLQICAREGKVQIAHSHSAPIVIDQQGITGAVKSGIAKLLKKIDPKPKETEVRLDGLLKAPTLFKYQHTIVRGDETEALIALASVVAKVRRDRLMINLAKKYPAYGFREHKGYGTKAHYEALRMHGPSKTHRLSYLCKMIDII